MTAAYTYMEFDSFGRFIREIHSDKIKHIPNIFDCHSFLRTGINFLKVESKVNPMRIKMVFWNWNGFSSSKIKRRLAFKNGLI